MQDRLKQIQEQFMTFWNKYTNKQKTIIICVGAGIILAFAFLSVYLTRPIYVQLISFMDADQANEVIMELEEKELDFKKSLKDGVYIIEVNKKDFVDATMLVMGGNNKYSAQMSWEEALQNGMSTTTMEKTTKQTLALQSSLGSALSEFEGVKSASVFINRPKDDYSLYGDKKDATVGVKLDLDKDAQISAETANAMAMFLMTSVGNTDTDKISIVTLQGDLLFGGSEGEGLGGNVNSTSEYKEKLSKQFEDNLAKLFVKVGFDDTAIDSNFIFNMDKISELSEKYSAPEGREEGMKANDYSYENTNSSGSGGIPGVESNTEDTDYMLETDGTSQGSVKLNKNDYLPDKVTTNIDYEIGAVKEDESSISIVATQLVVIKEETLKNNGSLDNMTFDEYIAANSQPQPLNLPTADGGYTLDDYKQMVSGATGISPNNINIMMQTMNVFEAKEKAPSVFTVNNVLMFVLAALIIAMMLFVVFKSTAPVEITEVEPELSIEQLLATTKENQSLEDIEFSEKSEARKMIEKFVDEKPEAVAHLLRNWLNEDWG